MTTIIYREPKVRFPKNRSNVKLPSYLIRRKITIIREKIIARKYGNIYLSKVFGKYHPSACTRYYKTKLLTRALDKLKSHWFNEKHVHRLFSKAKIFSHNKIMKNVFIIWHRNAIKFTLIKHQSQVIKYQREAHLSNGVLQHWKILSDVKKKVGVVTNRAIEVQYSMYTVLFLLRAKENLCRQILNCLLDERSLRFARNQMLHKSIGKWKFFIFQQKFYKNLKNQAEAYQRNTLTRCHFVIWRNYTRYRHARRELKTRSAKLYDNSLSKKLLRSWKYKYLSRIAEKKNSLAAIKFYEKLIRLKLFQSWKRYARHKLHRRRLEHKATFFHAIRSKQKIFEGISKYVARCNNSKLATRKLNLFYRRLLLAHVWTKWTRRVEERYEFDLHDELLLAMKFSKRKMLKTYLAKWLEYKILEEKRKTLKSTAINYLNSKYQKRYFSAWKAAREKIRHISVLNEKARKFHEENLMHLVISRWVKTYDDSIRTKEKYEKAVSHEKLRKMTKYFLAWVYFSKEKIRVRNLIMKATQYYSKTLQRKTLKKLITMVLRARTKRQKIRVADNFYKSHFCMRIISNWKNYCLRIKRHRNIIDLFTRRREYTLKGKITAQWKLYANDRKCVCRKTLTSLNHHRKKVMRSVLVTLSHYVLYRRQKQNRLSYLETGVSEIEFRVKTICIKKWKFARSYSLKLKCRLFHATEFHERRIMYKYMNNWKKFVAEHSSKSRSKQNLYNAMLNFILRRYVALWYNRYQIRMHATLREQGAVNIFERRITHKYFYLWKHFFATVSKERSEIHNAMEFHKKLLVKDGLQRVIKFYLCNAELRYRSRINNITAKSLSDFETLKKYFQKLHHFTFRTKIHRTRQVDENVNVESIEHRLFKFRKPDAMLMPRFVIPDFMKEEITLRSGTSGWRQVNFQSDKRTEITPMKKRNSKCKNSATGINRDSLKTQRASYQDEQSENSLFISIDHFDPFKNLSQQCFYRPRHLTLSTQEPCLSSSMIHMGVEDSKSLQMSPDTTQQDSARTYIVDSPVYCVNSNKEYLFRKRRVHSEKAWRN